MNTIDLPCFAGKTADADAYEPLPDGAGRHVPLKPDLDGRRPVFPYNNTRILRQLATPISVIIGNPPYFGGQSSANDLNANEVSGRAIEQTYAKRTAQLEEQPVRPVYSRVPVGDRPHW